MKISVNLHPIELEVSEKELLEATQIPSGVWLLFQSKIIEILEMAARKIETHPSISSLRMTKANEAELIALLTRP